MSNLNQWLEAIASRLDRAHAHICQLCEKSDRWTMSIPVSKGDSDMMLQAPLDDLALAAQVIQVMLEAMNRYARPDNWESTTIESTCDGIGCGDFDIMKFEYGSPPIQVGGRAARQALAKVESLLSASRKGE